MIINKLEKTEIGFLRQLFIKIFEEGFTNYPPKAKKYILATWNLSELTKKRKNKSYLFLLAKENSLPVGYLIGKLYSDKLAVILWTGVLKTYQRRKIGSRMISRWEKWARENGATKLRASTSNFSNEKFYNELGFNKYPRIVKNDWGMDKLVFLKKI